MTKPLCTTEDLKQRILQLEQLQATQLSELKHSAVMLVDNFSPAQILKSTLKDITTSGDLRWAVIDTALGIGAGFLSRKLYVSNSHNILRKITGSAVQFFVTNFVRNKMSHKRENKIEEEQEV